MNQKQRQRLGSAIIASTMLSCAAVSLAGVDQAQAAVLTYNFTVGDNLGSGFFKFNNSSFAGIGEETFLVSEGRFDTPLVINDSNYGLKGKDYYDLVGAKILFDGGILSGLQARGEDFATNKINRSEERRVGKEC